MKDRKASTGFGRRDEWLRVQERPFIHLQAIGILSALIFAFNFCLEILVVFSLNRDHQILSLTLLLCLATWAIFESVLLERQHPKLQLFWLKPLTGLQFLVEGARLALTVWGQPFGIESHFGMFKLDVGPLFLLIPLYVFVFFGISKSLILIHAEELNKAWEQLTMAAVAQSKQQERQQLLRDMHDGFGSQVATMRIMAEQGRLPANLIPQYLAEISADLHLVVDTFKQADDVTLATALADMRYRLRRRLNSDDVHVHWKIELGSSPHLPSHAILSILRIVQEATNNALRHAAPANIWIGAVLEEPGNVLRISVRDDGIGLPEAIQSGRGLSNMETRSRELGGHIQWVRLSTGTEVQFSMKLGAS